MANTVLVPFTLRNQSAVAVDSRLSVTRVKPQALAADPIGAVLPTAALEVRGFGLIEHHCDRFTTRDEVKPLEGLALRYEAFDSREYALVIDLAAPLAGTKPASAVFSISERRQDGSSGGLLVVVTPAGAAMVPLAIPGEPNPSPLALAGPPLFSTVSYMPAPDAVSAVDRSNGRGFLCIEVVNPTKDILTQVVFYLECLGAVGASVESRVYELDTMAPGDRFYAAFPADFTYANPGTFRALFVAYDSAHGHRRLQAQVTVLGGAPVKRPSIGGLTDFR